MKVPTTSFANDVVQTDFLMHYVYTLLSEKDSKFYFGYSSDLKRRIKEHEAGKVASTKHRRPLKLVYYEAYIDANTAKQRELAIKSSGSVHGALVKRIKKSLGL